MYYTPIPLSMDNHSHTFATEEAYALRWLMGTATTKDINSIKTRITQLIMTQSSQQETLVHVISILNVTRYAAQVNTV